uniref:Uncharacterized protein n=1 Tax=Arundo donax TaxID=35708 RepID=A0A0A9ELF9_ARUDO
MKMNHFVLLASNTVPHKILYQRLVPWDVKISTQMVQCALYSFMAEMSMNQYLRCRCT